MVVLAERVAAGSPRLVESIELTGARGARITWGRVRPSTCRSSPRDLVDVAHGVARPRGLGSWHRGSDDRLAEAGREGLSGFSRRTGGDGSESW